MVSKRDHLSALLSVDIQNSLDPVTHIECGEIESLLGAGIEQGIFEVLKDISMELPFNIEKSPTSIEQRFIEMLKKISMRLPFKIEKFPSADAYNPGWYGIDLNEGYQLFSNGDIGRGPRLNSQANDVVDFVYDIYKAIFPNYTELGEIAKNRLESQKLDSNRYIWWLMHGSEVYNMYQVNRYFGLKSLVSYRRWACEELARQEIIDSPCIENQLIQEGWEKMVLIKKYMVHSLRLCGFSNDTASYLIWKNYYHEIPV